MKSLLVYICRLVILSIFFTGCQYLNSSSENTTILEQSQTINDHQIIPLKIGSTQLSVEVVNTQSSIIKGLGERDGIGSDGMLFSMPERQVVSFWMHGMRFPLDFVWIDDGKVVGVLENVAAPENPDSISLPSYSSEVPVTHVLELSAGKVAELKLSVGQTIEFSN